MEASETNLQSHVRRIQVRKGVEPRPVALTARLLSPETNLDSLDVAELITAMENDHGISLSDASPFPETWMEVLRMIESKGVQATREH